MAMTVDTLRITDTLAIPETGISAQSRSTILVQDDNAAFPIPLVEARVWDAFHTNLPGTAAADDLALIGGTLGTAPPMIQAGDCKALGATTRKLRIAAVVPECYVAGQTISIVLHAGMKTTIADTSCTIDVESYKPDNLGSLSADLCTTSAQSINSVTFAAKTFAINPATMSPGDVLDVLVSITVTDAATVTAVTPSIAAINVVCDIRG